MLIENLFPRLLIGGLIESITFLKTEYSEKKKNSADSSQLSVDELGKNVSQFTASRF